jgi:hypothetical protein
MALFGAAAPGDRDPGGELLPLDQPENWYVYGLAVFERPLPDRHPLPASS